jgi:exopolyphosphatase/guanosine-5'-triphosphate,3'-diphosphate pyrophosphatase
VLSAAFQALGIDAMQVSDGALREGLLYDLLGRISHEDVRERTALAMAQRYQVSQRFAQRVAQTAEGCRAQVAAAWGLEGDYARSMLRWAALLHEVGVAISHQGYHKHGAYLVQYSDMPGFSRQDQVFLSLLIRSHRRKLPRDDLVALPAPAGGIALRTCVLLRLAVLLNHSRSPEPSPRLRLSAAGDTVEVLFPPRWLARHPLIRANLEQEAEYLKAARMRLAYE